MVPSQTELLFALDLFEEVVGVTKFCTHPVDLVKEKTKIGGTKNINLEKVKDLNPDLILGNKEENQKEQIEVLSEHFPVWVSDVYDLKTALEMNYQVGKICNRHFLATILNQRIEKEFKSLILKERKAKVVYLIWNKPMMVAASGTFIDAMMQTINFENVFGMKTRYPEISLEELNEIKPEYILLSSEPYPFKEEDKKAFQKAMPNTKVKLVDGTFFSWYGSRLAEAPAYFRQTGFCH